MIFFGEVTRTLGANVYATVYELGLDAEMGPFPAVDVTGGGVYLPGERVVLARIGNLVEDLVVIGKVWPGFIGVIPIGNAADLRWETQEIIGDNANLMWAVQELGVAGKSISLSYKARAVVGDAAQVVYNTRSGTVIGDTAQLVWKVRAIAGDSAQLVFNTSAGGTIGDTVSLRYKVRSIIGDAAQLRYKTIASSGGAGLLKFAPPTLTSPITINVPTGTTKYTATMNSGQDYIVVLPNSPRGQVVLAGGRHVKLIGGEIQSQASFMSLSTEGDRDKANRGIKIENGANTSTTAARTIFIEGVKMTGPNFSDPIHIADRVENNLTVILQNIHIEGIVYGGNTRPPNSHADAIQAYGGPAILKIDRFRADHCTYQGFFFNDADGRSIPTGHQAWEIHNVHLIGDDTSGPEGGEHYLLTDIQGPRTTNTSNIYIERTANIGNPNDSYAGCAAWDWHDGPPPGGTYVGDGVAGIGYVSPGYQ